MSATIKPVGMLKGYIQNLTEARCSSGVSVRQALDELAIPSELVALVTLNDVVKDKDYILQDGDVIQVMAIIGGG